MATTFILDISHHQDKSLDLAKARADGIAAVFMKAGQGNSMVDADFASNLAEARAAGQLVAAYWYQVATVSAQAHVDKIRTVVPKDVPIILDVEASSGGIALTRDLIARLATAGYRVPLVYIPRWYWQQLGSPSLAGLPPLWSSRYPNNVVGLLASEWAEVPASYWAGYGGGTVAVLQFTSSARVAGYQPLDASAFQGTRDQLAALLNQSVEDDMAWTENDFDTALFTDYDDATAKTNAKTIRFRDVMAELRDRTAELVAGQAGLVAAVAALSKDSDLSVDKVEAIIRDAVKENVKATVVIDIPGATQTTTA